MPPKISIMPIKPRAMLCNTRFAEQGLSERSIERTKVSLFYFARQNIFNQICHSALKEKAKSFRVVHFKGSLFKVMAVIAGEFSLTLSPGFSPTL